jgi:hypothetical protein
MYLADIVLQDLFDPSILETALKATFMSSSSARTIKAVGANNSKLIYILVSVVITAVVIYVIWAFVERQKKQQKAEELAASYFIIS